MLGSGSLKIRQVKAMEAIKKEQKSYRNSNSQRSTKLREARPEPKKGNGGEMQRLKKNRAKCCRAHSG